MSQNFLFAKISDSGRYREVGISNYCDFGGFLTYLVCTQQALRLLHRLPNRIPSPDSDKVTHFVHFMSKGHFPQKWFGGVHFWV